MWTPEVFEKIVVGLGLGSLTVILCFQFVNNFLKRLDGMGATIASQMAADREEARKQVDRLFEEFRTDTARTHTEMQDIINRLINVVHDNAIAVEALKATVDELKRDREQGAK